jgi:predicted NUDIX family NTP pyrophosphohydrolase
MQKKSCGILMYRRRGGVLQVFLIHPGGPLWARRDLGAWSIPKGEQDHEEDMLFAAKREFEEETGIIPRGKFFPLSPVKQAGGKIVQAWGLEGDCDPEAIRSNTFALEWPPRSGIKQMFSEVDRAAWFDLDEAKRKINKGQVGLIEELGRMVSEVDDGVKL